MTKLEKAIKNKGLKKKWIADQLGINDKTLNSFLKYDKINQVINFVTLIDLLTLDKNEIFKEILDKKNN